MELLIAIAVGMVLAAAGIPSLNSYLRHQTLIQAAENLKSDLRRVQTMAIGGSKSTPTATQSSCWGVRTGGTCPANNYCMASYGIASPCAVADYSLYKQVKLGDSRVGVSAGEVVFQRLTGFVSSAVTFTLSLSGSTCTITVDVSATGSVAVGSLTGSC